MGKKSSKPPTSLGWNVTQLIRVLRANLFWTIFMISIFGFLMLGPMGANVAKNGELWMPIDAKAVWVYLWICSIADYLLNMDDNGDSA